MKETNGKIIGYIINDNGIMTEFSTIFVEFIVEFYNEYLKKNNYTLTKGYDRSKYNEKNIVSKDLQVQYDSKGKIKVSKISFNKSKNVDLKKFTYSEYYKLLMNNNDLSDKEIRNILKKDKEVKGNTSLVLGFLLLSLTISILIFTLMFGKINYLVIIFDLVFLFASIIWIINYFSDLTKKRKISNKKPNMISVKVIDILDELNKRTVILENVDNKSKNKLWNCFYYYISYENDLFNIGDIYKFDINQYKKPFIRTYREVKNIICTNLTYFEDEYFTKIS